MSNEDVKELTREKNRLALALKTEKKKQDKKDAEIADLKQQLLLKDVDYRKLLEKTCQEMSECKRVGRYLSILEEELAITKDKLETSERENRNLRLWMSINGVRKDI